MNKAEMLSTLAQRTGLKRETIKDLMKNGWYYEELTDQGRALFFNTDSKYRRS